MYYERKLRDKRRRVWQLVLGLLFMMMLMHTDKIMAETLTGNAPGTVQLNSAQNLLLGSNGETTAVGRYAINYTGNILSLIHI